MLDLSLHGDAEEGDKVHDEDGPEHWDVEEVKESADECDDCSLGGGIPELELRQTTDERPELFVLMGWQLRAILVFCV